MCGWDYATAGESDSSSDKSRSFSIASPISRAPQIAPYAVMIVHVTISPCDGTASAAITGDGGNPDTRGNKKSSIPYNASWVATNNTIKADP